MPFSGFQLVDRALQGLGELGSQPATLDRIRQKRLQRELAELEKFKAIASAKFTEEQAAASRFKRQKDLAMMQANPDWASLDANLTRAQTAELQSKGDAALREKTSALAMGLYQNYAQDENFDKVNMIWGNYYGSLPDNYKKVLPPEFKSPDQLKQVAVSGMRTQDAAETMFPQLGSTGGSSYPPEYRQYQTEAARLRMQALQEQSNLRAVINDPNSSKEQRATAANNLKYYSGGQTYEQQFEGNIGQSLLGYGEEEKPIPIHSPAEEEEILDSARRHMTNENRQEIERILRVEGIDPERL